MLAHAIYIYHIFIHYETHIHTACLIEGAHCYTYFPFHVVPHLRIAALIYTCLCFVLSKKMKTTHYRISIFSIASLILGSCRSHLRPLRVIITYYLTEYMKQREQFNMLFSFIHYRDMREMTYKEHTLRIRNSHTQQKPNNIIYTLYTAFTHYCLLTLFSYYYAIYAHYLLIWRPKSLIFFTFR